VTDPAEPGPQPTADPGPEPERPRTERAGEPERLGPLALQRYRKPDDRQLIIYRVSPERS
jgi:hypothetical protein